MPRIGNVNRPNINVFLLGVLDSGIEIGIDGIETPAEIINARREQNNGLALTGVRPALDPILKCEIRACKCSRTAQGQAKCLGSKSVIRGEVLRNDGRSVS